MLSARPGSAGEIRCMTGTRSSARGYDWWIGRMRWAIETCDIVRIDHFRGFEAYWEIPADEPTAVHGHWVQGPNASLFQALKGALGKLPFIAEDLGYITREVHDLAQDSGYSGHEDPAVWIRQQGRAYLPAAHVRARLRGIHRHSR